MNRYSPYAHISHTSQISHGPRMPRLQTQFKSGGLVRFIPEIPKSSDNTNVVNMILIPPVVEANESAKPVNGYEMDILEEAVRCETKKALELTNKILACESELAKMGAYKTDYEYLLPATYIHSNEYHTRVNTHATDVDDARNHFQVLTAEFPEYSLAYAEVHFDNTFETEVLIREKLGHEVYDAAIAYKKALRELYAFVASYRPVNIDEIRLAVLDLSDTISRCKLDLRHLQRKGIDIGRTIFPF